MDTHAAVEQGRYIPNKHIVSISSSPWDFHCPNGPLSFMLPTHHTFSAPLGATQNHGCDEYKYEADKGGDATSASVADQNRYANDCVHFSRYPAARYPGPHGSLCAAEQTKLLFEDENQYQEITVQGLAEHSRWGLGSTAPNFQALAADLENCRLSLKATFERCQDKGFPHACNAISCVLSSQRPLRTVEISIAITLLIGEQNTCETDIRGEEVEIDSWLKFCEAVLYEDRSGLVHFTADAMPTFISAFRIQGIDASHTTIATACLVQTRLDRKIQAGTKNSRHAGSAFSAYAAQYWQYHCAKAGQSAMVLRVEPSKSRAVVNKRHCDSSREHSGQEVRAGAREEQYCSEDDRSVNDDWVVL